MTTCRNSRHIDALQNDIDGLWELYNGAEARLRGAMTVPWTKPYYKDLTLAGMAEFRIAREYHVLHSKPSPNYPDFEDCIHEVCEDARELILQLKALEDKFAQQFKVTT